MTGFVFKGLPFLMKRSEKGSFQWWQIGWGKLFWVEITGSCLVVVSSYSLYVWWSAWVCDFCSANIIGHKVFSSKVCNLNMSPNFWLRLISSGCCHQKFSEERPFSVKGPGLWNGFYCWSSNECILFRANGKMTRWWILPDVTYLTLYLSRRTYWDDTVFLQFLDIYLYGSIFSINLHFFNIHKHSSFMLLEQKYSKSTSDFLFVVEMFTWLCSLTVSGVERHVLKWLCIKNLFQHAIPTLFL